MPIRIAVIMDPIQNIQPKKDTTLALMLEAQNREYQISYMQVGDLSFSGNKVVAKTRGISVRDDDVNWYILGDERVENLEDYDVVFMRKDPPVNQEYIYCTYLLTHLQQQGVLICNNPSALRDINEKFYISHFPECTPPTLITQDFNQIYQFSAEHGTIVVKPLDGMGGRNIFKLEHGESNFNVTLEMMTNNWQQFVMVQKFIPESSDGDKRILMIDGKPLAHALLRVPQAGEFRGNIARGATVEGVPLTERDHWICERLSPMLKSRGLLFVGIDILGDYLTEINITSPTCVRELDAIYQSNICAQWLDVIEQKLNLTSR